MPHTNALHNSNKLKLGQFSLNADGGIAITKVPERRQAGWLWLHESGTHSKFKPAGADLFA